MKRFFRKPDSVGHPPGTLVPTDKTEQQPLKLTLFNYGPQMPVEESQVQRVSDVFPFDSIKDVIWLNVGGSLQVETLEEIGGYLDIHPLVLEDILDTSQRPKNGGLRPVSNYRIKYAPLGTRLLTNQGRTGQFDLRGSFCGHVSRIQKRCLRSGSKTPPGRQGPPGQTRSRLPGTFL